MRARAIRAVCEFNSTPNQRRPSFRQAASKVAATCQRLDWLFVMPSSPSLKRSHGATFLGRPFFMRSASRKTQQHETFGHISALSVASGRRPHTRRKRGE